MLCRDGVADHGTCLAATRTPQSWSQRGSGATAGALVIGLAQRLWTVGATGSSWSAVDEQSE